MRKEGRGKGTGEGREGKRRVRKKNDYVEEEVKERDEKMKRKGG